MMSSKDTRRKRAVLWGKQNGLCCYCLVQLTPLNRSKKGRKPLPTTETIEHLRRKIEGGSDRYDNLALSCFECNTERGGMDWLTYTTYRRGELWDIAA